MMLSTLDSSFDIKSSTTTLFIGSCNCITSKNPYPNVLRCPFLFSPLYLRVRELAQIADFRVPYCSVHAMGKHENGRLSPKRVKDNHAVLVHVCSYEVVQLILSADRISTNVHDIHLACDRKAYWYTVYDLDLSYNRHFNIK